MGLNSPFFINNIMNKKEKFNSVEEYLRFKMNQSGTVHLEYEKSVMEQYNKSRFSNVNGYRFIPEKELWENRNHSYKLWM